MAKKKQKYYMCEDECPKCHATGDDIDWGHLESDDPPYRPNNVCQKCGCVFTEVYKYSYSEYQKES
jgi:transcription initiation factor TFIIIB Brf1 subunit/transcription initiation factor TFIIB